VSTGDLGGRKPGRQEIIPSTCRLFWLCERGSGSRRAGGRMNGMEWKGAKALYIISCHSTYLYPYVSVCTLCLSVCDSVSVHVPSASTRRYVEFECRFFTAYPSRETWQSRQHQKEQNGREIEHVHHRANSTARIRTTKGSMDPWNRIDRIDNTRCTDSGSGWSEVEEGNARVLQNVGEEGRGREGQMPAEAHTHKREPRGNMALPGSLAIRGEITPLSTFVA